MGSIGGEAARDGSHLEESEVTDPVSRGLGELEDGQGVEGDVWVDVVQRNSLYHLLRRLL